MLTDQELIQRIEERTADEWPAAELEFLRQRWTESAEIRDALQAHLALESQLAAGLGPTPVSVESILQRAAVTGKKRTSPLWFLVGLCALAALIGAFAFRLLHQPQWQIAEQPLQNQAAPEPESVVPEAPTEVTEAVVPPALPPAPAVSALAPENHAPLVVRIQEPEADPWATELLPEAPRYNAAEPVGSGGYDDIGHGGLTESQARRWLAEVEGERLQLFGEQVGGRSITRLQGLARLKAPWSADTVLRLTAFDIEDLSIHCWRGPNGRTLRYYTKRDPHHWAAFRTRRETVIPRPADYEALLTTDNAAFFRSTPGTFDLRWQDGRLILSRGDLVLLSVLTPEAPDEIYLEGHFRLRGISLQKATPLTLPEIKSPPPLWAGSPAADWPWQRADDLAVQWERPAADVTRWTAGRPDREATCWRELPQTGFFDIVLQLDEASPGTGVYLGDAEGKPISTLGLFRNRKNQRLTCGFLRPGERRDDAEYDRDHFATPTVAAGSWIRLVGGAGVASILVSDDGLHWGNIVENPLRDFRGTIRTVGLISLPGPEPRILAWRSLQVRELTGLSDLIDPSLLVAARTVDWSGAGDRAKWIKRVEESRPADTTVEAWLPAASLASLPFITNREFRLDLFEQILPGSIELADRDWASLFSESALLFDWWEEAAAKRLQSLYVKVGNAELTRKRPGVTEHIRSAWLRAPVWTRSKARDAWDDLARRELLQECYAADEGWPARTLNCSRRWRFSRLEPHPDARLREPGETVERLARWAAYVASTELGDAESAAVIPALWRHPYQPQVNKEAYNFAAELSAALEAGQIADACRVAMSLRTDAADGLLPFSQQPGLAVSVPVLLEDSLLRHPEFAEQLRRDHADAGRFRMRQAVDAGDSAAIRLAALQFAGTEIAGEALLWLGDQQLAAGNLFAAEDWYARSSRLPFETFRTAALARLELLSALRGEVAPLYPPAAPQRELTLGNRTVTADEFGALVESIRAARANGIQIPWTSIAPPEMPSPGQYRAIPRHQFDGSPGQHAGKFDLRDVDPFGRQLAVTVDGPRTFVSNRVQVSAYVTGADQPIWSVSLGSGQGEAHDFPNQPMAVAAAGDALFVRRQTKAGVELTRLRAGDGQVVWQQRPGLHVLTDPIPWHDRLLVLVADRTEDESLQILATAISPDTGAVQEQRLLFRLRDAWEGKPPAAWIRDERSIILTVGGVTASISPVFDVEWLDRPLWLPAQADVRPKDFYESPPVVRDGRVYVAQPGVKAVRCLSADSGRTLWQQSSPDVTGLAAVLDKVVLVREVGGLVALSTETGEIVWWQQGEFAACSDDSVLLVVFAQADRKLLVPVLVWLDPQDGHKIAESPLIELASEAGCLGPWWMTGERLWCSAGLNWKEGRRVLTELIPQKSE
ncbi:PQQ-binding-like beta-propeller repeat protein [Planctellipticum variicoloris]|uniref:outer membrane protein assembly factor BamB family protein n=1 Tax=Planctellipticum variicoloris TaxID=3064265 RepID=UPI00301371A5|nr:PQQ-like beta-propeller repeat protein [Planctomycetaceae bacterium SH412]